MERTIMSKEINQQPRVLSQIEDKNKSILSAIADEVNAKNITHVTFAARGTSDHASIYGQYMMSAFCNMVAGNAMASTVTLYEGKINFSNDLVIGVSQSGKAADMIAVLEQAKKSGAVTVAITNDEDSPMAKVAKYHLFCNAEEEVSVAATKTFTAQLGLIALLTAYISKNNELLDNIRKVSTVAQETLDTIKPSVEKIADKLTNIKESFILGRGFMYAVALEAALKTQETCYIKSKGYAISDFYHGPLAQVEKDTPVIVLAPKGKAFDDACKMIDRLLEIGNSPIVITNDKQLSEKLENSVIVPDTGFEATEVFPFAIFAQSLAENISVNKGLNPDAPRALKKVTITK